MDGGMYVCVSLCVSMCVSASVCVYFRASISVYIWAAFHRKYIFEKYVFVYILLYISFQVAI